MSTRLLITTHLYQSFSVANEKIYVYTQALAVECLKCQDIAKIEKKSIGYRYRTIFPMDFPPVLAISRHFKHSTASACGVCHLCLFFLGLTFDWIQKRLYWCESNTGIIGRV